MRRFLLPLFCLLLMSCGGGGEVSGGGGGNEGPVSIISGVAAAGSPLVGTVTLKDSAGNQKRTATNSDGTFTINISNLTPPFFLSAEGKVRFTDYRMVSVATQSGTVNINPLTNLAVAAIAKARDPDAVYNNPLTYAALVTDTAVNSAITDITRMLKPAIDAINVAATNPLTSTFVADNSGFDKFLDTIGITIDTNTGVFTVINRANGNETIGTGTTTTISSAPSVKYRPLIGIRSSMNTRLILDWTALPGAKSYNVYTSTTPGVSKSNGIKSETTMVGGGLTCPSPSQVSVNYYFVVTAVFDTGESEESNEVSGLCP